MKIKHWECPYKKPVIFYEGNLQLSWKYYCTHANGKEFCEFGHKTEFDCKLLDKEIKNDK